MIANHSKKLSFEFQFRRLLEEIDQEFMVEDSSEDSLESTNPEEPQEISDMFAEIDQALDELDDVVAAEEGTEMYAIFAEPISFSLVRLVVIGEETFAILDVDGDDGEQRVCDEAVIPDKQCAKVVGDGEKRVCDGAVIPYDQCAVVVRDEGCISVVDGDVIKNKVVAKQGDEPDEVLEKNRVGQDGVLVEEKFEDQGRSIKRRRLMADKKPKDDAK
ncbi:hypothetical protein CTI12_AA312520 [Artemisia annua]|uniref:Uncharacterized protein n=1 Tax=Artemisia annua TaxID=35608 RepID=A0A2U1N3L6_ARTAN|nr:hypothetical protein CTI12_AA312520 [Artemisia annua]